MNTDQIAKLVKGSGALILASDQLPKRKVNNEIIITNTDVIAKQGLHWIIFAKLGALLIYSDPLGLPPMLQSFVSFINLNASENCEFKFNRFPFQGEDSSNCGRFCVLLCWHLYFGLAFEDFCERYSACAEENEITLEGDWKRFLIWFDRRQQILNQ